MSFTVHITGIQSTQLALRTDLAKAVAQLSQITTAALVGSTPRKTGRAARGWKTTTQANGFVVENRVPYVGYLESGTRKMRAANAGRGIVGPALNQIKGQFK